MHMHKTVGQEMSNRAAAESRQHALDMARREAKADAAVSFSSHLDRLATHVASEGFSSVEIVELLRQEAEKFNGQAIVL
ncbi:Protein of uncharacterised function (DUF2732) [Yersinia bercovieri]|uniref:DUF2732 family protein n=1 Tax=Yersinia bercovieri TaxID=634 RepID=UPI00061B92A2|nr:DUF2732 family protein [Yersinia bercovieri]CNF54506.1 Protein of uncharacterised function (DUF2732) [Yersinia bercovieri]